jgi:hypothetical protein
VILVSGKEIVMQKMIKTLVGLSALACAALASTQASAAISCKSPLTAKGMFYTTKKKAKSSADYRWGLKAASTHNPSWAHVGQAKGKSYKCTYGHGKKGKLYNCTLTAKPCRKTTVCRGTVTAKGMFYTGKSKAKESARYRWGLQAASAHGPAFAHWGKAKATSIKCSYGHGKKGNLYNCVAKANACK